VRVISRRVLRDFFEKAGREDSKQPLLTWAKIAERAKWKSPNDVKKVFRSADVVGKNRIVFNIAGNKYRLVVKMEYRLGLIFIRFVGTHSEYEQIDVETV
jgi:mRNA interferase HigB